jgi:peroxiredoxin
MEIKKLFFAFTLAVFFLACNTKEETGRFTVNGAIKNIDNQHIYLEQLFFSQQDPQVLDTAQIKEGQFKVTALSSEEGLYRIRFEKMNSGFIFINDQPKIDFNADIKDVSLQGPIFNSPANIALKKLLINIEGQRLNLVNTSRKIDSIKALNNNDSVLASESLKLSDITNQFNKFIVGYIDTVSHPVIALFALGYTQGIDPAFLNTVVPNLAKRFPTHQGIAGIVAQFNQMLAAQNKPKPINAAAPGIGSVAPDFTMNDTEGKPFSLSQLKGKYVLVDFWASWCAPCRGENPNVVAAYHQFKNKNFTILGVSLDDDKDKWLKAITADNLSWKQVSDLKGWGNATVALYGYDGIPYNILIDPKGKIIATSLRESDLQAKLAEVLH